MENYNPFTKTALKRRTLSVPMRELLVKELLKGNILDFGCGVGDDVNFLNQKGLNIVGYDKFNPMFNDGSLLKGKYDVVVCNYVLNVIPDLEEHRQVVEQLRSLSDLIYISVRSDSKAIKKSWEYNIENRCWKTSTGSYQRFYSEDDVKDLFGYVEYIISNNNLRLFRLL